MFSYSGIIGDSLNNIVSTSSAKQALNHAEMREDTAIQRQVSDLKAAGLNPILATNYNGASSAAAVKYVDSPATTKMANSAEKNARTNQASTIINSLSNMINSAANIISKFG